MDPNLKRIALGVQYDDSPWNGYQKQLDRHTVQDQLEIALAKFARVDIATTCAGRTDTGVHALEQVVHFDTDLTRDVQSWVRGVNTFLPDSIAVRWATEVPQADDPLFEFHARFSARARTYHYVLYNHPVRSPLLAGKAGWTFRPLDLARMREGAAHLIGKHDFTAFRSSQCQAKSPVKDMQEIRIEQIGDAFVFTLRANAFLHHMVRNLMGCLLAVGQGLHAPDWIADVLAARSRAVAAPSFAPDGLYFLGPVYAPHWGLPDRVAGLDWLPQSP